jgi:hypothetical protein
VEWVIAESTEESAFKMGRLARRSPPTRKLAALTGGWFVVVGGLLLGQGYQKMTRSEVTGTYSALGLMLPGLVES